jgi:hypothetical protein
VRSIADSVKRLALVLAALALVAVAGCASKPAGSAGSENACVQFAVTAVRDHITVTAVPPACRGLSQTDVNEAIGLAVRIAVGDARGRVYRRQLIGSDSQYLAGLVHAVRAGPLGTPPSSGALGGGALRLAALASWLVTAALGLLMMAGWVRRAWRPGSRPVLNFVHLGLATAGLLAWVCYLITGLIAVGWTAWGLLFPAVGLGMALVFLNTGAVSSRRRVVIVAHIVGAVVTVLLAVIAVIATR